MALAKTGLGGITNISGSASSTVYTVSSSKTAYIRGISIFNVSNGNTMIASVYVVPNNSGSVGTAADTNKLARIQLAANDTYFFEFAFPITLAANNDTIQVQNETSGVSCNVLVIGDKEA